jgi:anti-anti-sigma regulatory factor
MLQIKIEERAGSEIVLTLEGQLSEASGIELMALWKELRRNCPGKACIVDLAAVGAMDEAGEGAICSLALDGVRFLARGPMLDRTIDLVYRTSVQALQAGCKGFRSGVFNR